MNKYSFRTYKLTKRIQVGTEIGKCPDDRLPVRMGQGEALREDSSKDMKPSGIWVYLKIVSVW